jgi:IPT/TIG domain-containing protein/PASTA domain-containing protein
MKLSRLSRFTLTVAVLITAGLASAGAAQGDSVLLFGPSVSGGATSPEAQQAAAQGLQVDVADATAWASMTTAQFASYRAIIIGDNDDSTNPSDLDAAVANAATWGAAVKGNVVLTGGDAETHYPASLQFINKGIGFAAAIPGQTGAYVAWANYYRFVNGGVDAPVTVLDAFSPGGFSSSQADINTIHIDPATTPAPSGLTDGDLSGWGTTAHAFMSRFPTPFKVLAVSVDAAGTYTTSDGQTGFPSFLIRPSFPGITSIGPNSGSAKGGTVVTVNGHGFAGTSVNFGNKPARSFKVVSDSQITAVSPKVKKTGTVDISVTTALAKTSSVAADKFTYTGCIVPKVKGKTLKRARKVLRRRGCRLGKVRGEGDRGVKQRPKPGKVLPPGGKVKVTLG